MYFYLVLAVTIILVALNWAAIRSRIYDILIVSMTAAWYTSLSGMQSYSTRYKTVIDKLEPGSLVLDVGIGTGSALAKNSGLVRKKGIKVRGMFHDFLLFSAVLRLIRTFLVLFFPGLLIEPFRNPEPISSRHSFLALLPVVTVVACFRICQTHLVCLEFLAFNLIDSDSLRS